MLMDSFFTNRSSVITGAASGLGRALALELAGLGARLLLVDRDGQGLAETVGRVRGRGAVAESFLCDLSDREALQAMAEEVQRPFGGVELLINNAGVALSGELSALSEADWRWAMEINLLAPVRLTRALLPQMLGPGRRTGRQRGFGGGTIRGAQHDRLQRNQIRADRLFGGARR